MASGLLHVLLGSLLYGPVTFGRLLVVTLHFCMVMIGTTVEEGLLRKEAGLQYRQFMLEVPSRIIPDYRVLLFMSD